MLSIDAPLYCAVVESHIKYPKVSEAAKASRKKLLENPEWRAKNSSPEFVELISKKLIVKMADPEFKERHAAATRAGRERHKDRVIVKPETLPEEKVIDLFEKGWLLAEIAREVGEGTRPNGRPIYYRVRRILIKAGVYPRKKALKAKAGC